MPAMRGARVVGQEVGDPDERGTRAPAANSLRARVVVAEPAADHRPGEAAPFGIDVDDELARDQAVGEGDDARAGLEPAVGDEAACQPRVQRAHVGERLPHLVGGRDR